MFKVVRKADAAVREIGDDKSVANYITKDVSSDVSLAVTEATDYSEMETTNYNRIYFVLEGELLLKFDDQEVSLLKEDACFVEKGTAYEMKGTFKAVIINQPAFGT